MQWLLGTVEAPYKWTPSESKKKWLELAAYRNDSCKNRTQTGFCQGSREYSYSLMRVFSKRALPVDNGAVFSCVKINFVIALVSHCYMLWLTKKILHHFFIQSEVKRKPWLAHTHFSALLNSCSIYFKLCSICCDWEEWSLVLVLWHSIENRSFFPPLIFLLVDKSLFRL